MRPENIVGKKVLIAPLDWGMGHLTRCIPLIRQFQAQDCEVIFAGTKIQNDLIQKDFPEIITEKIPGYDVYLDSTESTYKQMLNQFRRIKRTVKDEKGIAGELVDIHSIEVVVSDNRYGFRADKAYNIFLTHQLQPQVPYFKNKVARKIRKYIKKFDCCWIPDNKEEPLCGELLNFKQSIPVHYIGWLSRFEINEQPIEHDVLVVVSGPMPESARFQASISSTLERTNWRYKIVSTIVTGDEHLIHNPSTDELGELIGKSEIIVSRAGYTSIMELMSLEKTAILIPTVGQYEQEYLASTIKNERLNFTTEDKVLGFLHDLDSIRKS